MNELTAALKEELNVDTAFTLPIFGGIDIPESIAVSWGIPKLPSAAKPTKSRLKKRKNSFCRTPSARQMRLWPKAKPLPKQSMPAACAMPMLKLPPWLAICVKSCWRAT